MDSTPFYFKNFNSHLLEMRTLPYDGGYLNCHLNTRADVS